MADTVDTITMELTSRRVKLRLTNISDGTGESAVVKVDKSTFFGVNGLEPDRLVIDEVEWSINGFNSVRLLFDHTTDDEAAVLATGSGYRGYWSDGGLMDPKSAGGTGDLLLTTNGGATGATYDIRLNVRFIPAA